MSARKFDTWTTPAHLAAGALDAMRVSCLMPAERERMAYMAGDIDAANMWAQFIDTTAANENQREEIETLKDEAADLKVDVKNLEEEIKTERAYICDQQARIHTLEKQLQKVPA